MPLPDTPKRPRSGRLGGSRLGISVSDRDELISRLETPDPEAKKRYGVFWAQVTSSFVKMEVWPNPEIHYPDLPHFVRSTWEGDFARLLIASGIGYEYEAIKVRLGGGRVYHPDFWVKPSGIWVEVKGLWMPGAKSVLTEFMDLYPEQKVLVLDSEYFKMLFKGRKGKK